MSDPQRRISRWIMSPILLLGLVISAVAQSSESTAVADSVVPEGPRIPILFAMERIAQPAPPQAPAADVDLEAPEADIYRLKCASCHGNAGQGIAVDWISVDPYAYERTASLTDVNADWYVDRSHFAEIVGKGMTGRVMPGNATLTKSEIDDLYAFVRSFSASQ